MVWPSRHRESAESVRTNASSTKWSRHKLAPVSAEGIGFAHPARLHFPGPVAFITHPKFSSGYYLKLDARVAHFFGSKQTCAEKHNSNSKPNRIPINGKAGGAELRPRRPTQSANLNAAGTGAQLYQRPARAPFSVEFARADVPLHAYFM